MKNTLASAACLGLLAFGPTLLSQNASLPKEKTVGKLETVATFSDAMLTGVAVSSQGRIFVNYPRWGDNVPFTVAEVVNGKAVAFPEGLDQSGKGDLENTLVSVQSVVVDPSDRLWILDPGAVKMGPTTYGGPKLVGVDLRTNQIFKKILFPPDVALKTSFLNDVRFDLRWGKEGIAYITDASGNGPNGIVVVDLASGKSWRRLNDHPSTKADLTILPKVEGEPLLATTPGKRPEQLTVGSDGIAISADGATLYYCPLASRHLYRVSAQALADQSKSEAEVAATVKDLGEKGMSDGMESDAQGNIYFGDLENNSVRRLRPDGSYEVLAHDSRILWPDTFALASNGYLYFTANQLHRQARFHEGVDLREKPYVLYRIKVDGTPVQLR